jgi:hypothetical protein
METTEVQHPGRVFIARFGPLRDVEDVLHYANFLRDESGLSDEPPVDLAAVLQRFAMPPPLYASLPGQQAVLLDDEIGLMLINEDDPITRQRFSQAHELMECVFVAHAEAKDEEHPGVRFRDHVKESLCEQGAAALLLPRSSFLKEVAGLGVSLDAASNLASLYQASLLATLFQMVRYAPGAHALVVWRLALKPEQERRLPPPEQLPMFGPELVPSPQKELRVWWATCTEGEPTGFIPKHKSIPRESLIFQAYDTPSLLSGEEFVNLGRVRGTCFVEAKRIKVGEEDCVVSLMHLPGDRACHLRPRTFQAP